MRAIQTRKDPKYQSTLTEVEINEVSQGDVLIQSHYSSINYKDALAITGRGKILKNFPLIPGIDVSGVVEESSDQRFNYGDKVLVTGCGMGEWQDGGFAQYVRVPAPWVIPLPEGLTLKQAMILGTAGFTSALCLFRMKQLDQSPDQGPIAITGASGGVGSTAIQIFSKAGFDVIAISSKTQCHEKLLTSGAKEVITPKDLNLGIRPLESARFGGAVDNVGGELLAGITRHVNLWGNIACVGLAASPELNTTVMPLILRGVSFLGISSANCPDQIRREIWKKLGNDWKPEHLELILSQKVSLEDVLTTCEQMIQQQTFGRILVDLRG